MICDDIRSHLLIAELDELRTQRATNEHLAACASCAARMARILAGTGAAADYLNGWRPKREIADLVERIQLDQARLRAGSEEFWRIMGTAAIVVLSLLVYLVKAERMAGVRAFFGYPDLPFIQSVEVRCLSPEQAAELAYGIVNPSGGTARPDIGNRSVILSGHRRVVADAEMVIRSADGTLYPDSAGPCPVPPAPSR